MIRLGVTSILMALGLAAPSWAAPPRSEAWVTAPAFQNKKEAENISGAACANPPSACLLIGDEKRYARAFSWSGKTVAPGDDLVWLLPGEDGDETDGEGVAYDPVSKAYFITGSHSLTKPKFDKKTGEKKNEGEIQVSRQAVYRIPTDPQGKPAIRQLGQARAPEIAVSDQLPTIIAGFPALQDRYHKPIAEHGLNIEGLAIKGGDLYFGFRGPVFSGGKDHEPGLAQVLKVNANSLFAAAPVAAVLYPLKLGGAGIRDIAAVGEGFLILSGPEADEPGPAAVYLWKGGAADPVCLQTIAHGPDAKPEVLLVLKDAPGAYEVLIMSDGVAGGAPVKHWLSGSSCP